MNELVPKELQESMNLAEIFVASGMFPDLKSQAAAVVKILAGREYGLSPLQSITELYMVNGKIAMSAKLIAAAIKRSGKYDYTVEESTNEACKIGFYSLDLNEITGDVKRNLLGNIEFTIKDAARAGIVNKDVWKNYPKALLFARTVSMGGRMFCPDVITAYTPEEVEDIAVPVKNTSTITITGNGEVVNGEIAGPDDHPRHPDDK
jgi:hypothetical protein